MSDPTPSVGSPTELAQALEATGYLADEGVATAAYLALRMGRPLFCEGEPGTGKTSLAAALAEALCLPLIRLQCHEGIDAAQALYDWDFPRQLLHLRTLEAASTGHLEAETAERSLYTERFLLARPLLRALTEAPCVLLVDEIDRADDEFEAFLLEVLDDNAVTIPELGEVRAATPPLVLLTSNRTRDVHDALKRRCLYHWLEHPDLAREIAILRRRIPGIAEALAEQVAALSTRCAAWTSSSRPVSPSRWTGHARCVNSTVMSSTPKARPPRSARWSSTARTWSASPGRGWTDCWRGETQMPHTEDPLVGIAGFAHALAAAGLPVASDAVETYTRALRQVDVADPGRCTGPAARRCAGARRHPALRPGVRELVRRNAAQAARRIARSGRIVPGSFPSTPAAAPTPVAMRRNCASRPTTPRSCATGISPN